MFLTTSGKIEIMGLEIQKKFSDRKKLILLCAQDYMLMQHKHLAYWFKFSYLGYCSICIV